MTHINYSSLCALSNKHGISSSGMEFLYLVDNRAASFKPLRSADGGWGNIATKGKIINNLTFFK